MIRRVTCISALAVALLAISIPSASAATVSPDKWAPKFCTALSSWQKTIQEKSDSMTAELQSVNTAGSSPEAILSEARDKLAQFLGEMVHTTDKATSAIKNAGTPSSPNGAKISATFVNGFKAVSKQFAKSQDQAKKLPTNSGTAFAAKGKQLGQALSDSSNTLSKGFSSISKLDSGKKLETAVRAAPECAFLNS